MDLDGDGAVDLVTANQNSDSIGILMGNCEGTFTSGVVESAWHSGNVSILFGASSGGPTGTFTTSSSRDSTPPEITLKGANPQRITLGGAYTDLGATAVDDVDGDLTSSIVIDATGIDTSTIGTDKVTHNVLDASRNAAIEEVRTVNVVDPSPARVDFDGGGTTDIAVFRRATGRWYIHGQSSIGWGTNGDTPTPVSPALTVLR